MNQAEKTHGNRGEKGKKYRFTKKKLLLTINTNDADMQNLNQIPQKMKTGIPNLTILVKLTLPFRIKNENGTSIINYQFFTL